MTNKVKVTRIRYGVHSIIEVVCVNYEDEIVFQEQYLTTIVSFNDPKSDTIQAILDDIKGIKASNPKMCIDTITMYTEDNYGERRIFFDMDDCENILFRKDGENE